MISDILSIGNKIDVSKASEKDSGNSYKTYASQLLELLDGNKANIMMPFEGGHLVPLNVGLRYSLCFYTSKGMYQCKAIVLARYQEDNIYIATVEFISALEKFQRRQFYRMSCVFDIEYHIIEADEAHIREKYNDKNLTNVREKAELKTQIEKLEQIKQPGIASNISGGGIRFGTQHSIPKDSRLLISFELDDDGKSKEMKVFGRVIASDRSVNENVIYENRVEFTKIDNEDREFIVRFVFNEERRQRKRLRS